MRHLTDNPGLLVFISWLFVINISAFAAMGADKRRARTRRRRIRESTLILLSLIGGSVGAILGMLAFRHKTRHTLFYAGLPLILALQVGAGYLLTVY